MIQKKNNIEVKKQGIICVMPFTSINFWINGEAYSCPCHHDEKNKIGHIKKNTISEMWNSDIARWVRRRMYEGEWQNICNPACPTIVNYLLFNKFIKYGELEKNEHMTPKLIEEIRAKNDYLESPPTFFQTDISSICNLRCIMCGRGECKEDSTMNKKMWTDLKRYLPTTKSMCLTGMGDPFARPDTRELLINYKGLIRFHIVTNGLLLPKYWEQVKHQKFAGINISIDAATKETYEKIRVGGKWKNLIRTLDLVKQNRSKFGCIVINMTVMRSNYKEISQFVDLAESYGFDCLFQKINGQFGDENIFELNNTKILNELENIFIDESCKKRCINVSWSNLLYYVNLLKKKGDCRNIQISGPESNLQKKGHKISSFWVQIKQIRQNIIIQLTKYYNRVIKGLSLPDARRRHYYELCLARIRIILNEGWRNFFWKDRNHFTHEYTPDKTVLSTITENNKTNEISKQGIICINPFIAMRFFSNGNSYSCECLHWPKYNFGNIKLNSIAEIWNSDVARSIRRKMYEGKWQDICNPTCPIIIDYLRYNKFIKYEDLEKNELVSPELIKEIRARKDYLESLPTYFQPDISSACNLRCIMCDREQIKDEPVMQKKLWTDLKQYLPTAKAIFLTGWGDAFARPDTRKLLIDYKGSAKFRILTNGLLLPRYWEKIKYQKFDSLDISIDAATKATYEKIRIGGRWEDLLKTIDLVKQNRDKFKNISINMTVMRSNYKEIPQFIDLAESYGFNCSFQAIRYSWGEENIFELNDTEALSELRKIAINEGSKKRFINICWLDLSHFLDLNLSVYG